LTGGSAPRSAACNLRHSMRRLALLLAAVFATAVLAGCGQLDYTANAETEGTWVDLGPLTYQVQISRYLNPHDVEDRSYFIGLPPGTKPVGKDEVWFGVFLRVKNYTKQEQTAASNFKIVDTEGTTYTPIPLDTEINAFAYFPAVISPAGVFPKSGSLAGAGPTEGGLILFRLKAASLQNRPLVFEMRLQGPSGEEKSTISLDL
jgi:hypothetical protein